jgi:hypothetical protein
VLQALDRRLDGVEFADGGEVADSHAESIAEFRTREEREEEEEHGREELGRDVDRDAEEATRDIGHLTAGKTEEGIERERDRHQR